MVQSIEISFNLDYEQTFFGCDEGLFLSFKIIITFSKIFDYYDHVWEKDYPKHQGLLEDLVSIEVYSHNVACQKHLFYSPHHHILDILTDGKKVFDQMDNVLLGAES